MDLTDNGEVSIASEFDYDASKYRNVEIEIHNAC